MMGAFSVQCLTNALGSVPNAFIRDIAASAWPSVLYISPPPVEEESVLKVQLFASHLRITFLKKNICFGKFPQKRWPIFALNKNKKKNLKEAKKI